MHVGAAEILRTDDLAGGGPDQRRSAEKDGALLADDDGLVRHGRNIGAARGAGSHHHGDLGDAVGRHRRLVVENAAEMVAIGKHLVLAGKVGAAGIDQIQAGQTILRRDLLRPEMLLDRHRVIGAALDGGVVGDDHAFPAGDPTDAGDQPGGRHLVVVQPVRRELADLQERAQRIEQGSHPIARQQLAAIEMPLPGFGVAAPTRPCRDRPQIIHQVAHCCCVAQESVRARINP